MLRILNSIPLLYLLMLLPGRASILDLFDGQWYFAHMMLESGLFSIYYLVATLAVTPALIILNLLGRGAGLGRWLMRRRKHFGMACFIFAAVHLLHYVRHTGDALTIWLEAFDFELAVGWIAFLIFLCLAITSGRFLTRKLGRAWKPIHRFIYLAAALTYLHWYLFDEVVSRVLFWTAVIVLIKLAHLGLRPLSAALRARRVAP